MRLCSVSDGSRRAVFDSMVDHPNLLSMNHQWFFDSFKIFWPTVEKNPALKSFFGKVLILKPDFSPSLVSRHHFQFIPNLFQSFSDPPKVEPGVKFKSTSRSSFGDKTTPDVKPESTLLKDVRGSNLALLKSISAVLQPQHSVIDVDDDS